MRSGNSNEAERGHERAARIFHFDSRSFAAIRFLAHDWFADSCIRRCPIEPVFCSVSERIATRGPHMNRLRLATSAMLAGVVLSAGCASPCGGCGGIFHRMSMFRARAAAPCECCSNCSGGPPMAGSASFVGEGPLLESPGTPTMGAPPLPGTEVPAPFPTPLGPPSVPSEPGRLNPTPLPNAAQPFPSQASSRVRR